MKTDPLSIIEAAYRPAETEQAWVDGVLEALAPYDVGSGVAASVIDLRPEATAAVRVVRTSGKVPFSEVEGRFATDSLPKQMLRSVFAPSPGLVWSLSTFATCAARAGFDIGLHEVAASLRVPAVWGGTAGQIGREVAMLQVFCADPSDVPRSVRRELGRVAVHVGAALRLRAQLSSGESDAEAILSPAGRVLHAEGEGQSAAARATLSEAVCSVERARGRTRRSDPDEALDLWRALFAGRWSIVEHVERDGKRMLVARRNAPGAPDAAALAPRERAVLAYAALGHSFKLIAYELGLATSTVHARLASGMRKLGVPSRSELIRIYGPVAAGLVEPPSRDPI